MSKEGRSRLTNVNFTDKHSLRSVGRLQKLFFSLWQEDCFGMQMMVAILILWDIQMGIAMFMNWD
jgi:hypothetical protein